MRGYSGGRPPASAAGQFSPGHRDTSPATGSLTHGRHHRRGTSSGLPGCPTLAGFAALQVGALGGFAPWPVLSPTVQSMIPPNSCVLSDTSPVLIMANRLVSSVPGCPVVLDSMGIDLALSHGLKLDTGAWKVSAVEQAWWRWFRKAQFVMLRVNTQASPRVPWTTKLRDYFHHDFRLVYEQDFTLYSSGQFDGPTASYRLYARDPVPETYPYEFRVHQPRPMHRARPRHRVHARPRQRRRPHHRRDQQPGYYLHP